MSDVQVKAEVKSKAEVDDDDDDLDLDDEEDSDSKGAGERTEGDKDTGEEVAAVKTEDGGAAPAEAAAESSDEDDFGDALDTAGDEAVQPAAEETVAEEQETEETPTEDLRRVDPPCPAHMQVRAESLSQPLSFVAARGCCSSERRASVRS